jgi:RNA polymerase sigma-70 factor, ECF subfamily
MAVQDSRSEQELVDAANRGDAAAMEEIYRRHRDWALRLAWRFTGDQDLAMDAAQEAFIYLFRKIGDGGLQLRAKLTTLLYPAIRNSALAARRKKRPGPLDEGLEPSVLLPVAPGDAERAERSRLLWAVLSRLSDTHREVLLMKIVDGMEHAEIALALGVPEGTVKSRLHHALAALREKVGEGERAAERFL